MLPRAAAGPTLVAMQTFECADITVRVEQGTAGLYYATSPQVRGLFLAAHTVEELMNAAPSAIADLRAAGDAAIDLVSVSVIPGKTTAD